MRSRPHRCSLLVALVGVVWLSSCRPAPHTEAVGELDFAWARRVDSPHIVLIVVDTLRKDSLGVYGYDRPTSPEIDRLAASSVVYDNAFSQAPWTLPAVAALLTSRYPAELGIQGFTRKIPDDELFLQEILRAHGYRTHGVVSHDFVGAKWGFDQGFDVFESLAGGHRSVTSEQVTETALRALDSFSEGPVFLFVHYFDPHFLYVDHPSHPVAGAPPQPESQWWLMPFRRLRAQARKGALSAAQRDYLRALYDSEVAFTDAQIGRLLAALERRGLLERSIIVLTADHGEEFLDHGGLGHTSTVYNELINVPLLIRWPAQDRPVRSGRYVAQIDLAPTLLDYVGIAVDPGMSGLDLRDRDSESTFFAETRRYQKVLAAISRQAKLVVNEETGQESFFDLQSDPSEQRPLADHPAAGLLRAELEAYRLRAQPGLARLEQEAEIEITDEELERLRALGYVD